LVALLSRLPGVGEKTAQGYGLHLVTGDAQISKDLGKELETLHDELRPCEKCGNVAEVIPGETPVTCAICKDGKRESKTLCVVGRVHDLLAIERTGAMRGRYFVLGRLLSPPEAIGPYSQAIRSGELVFLSGQIPLDPKTGELVTGDIAKETERVLDNLAAVLKAAGCGFADVVRTTIYLTNLGDFAVVNETYGKR